MIMPSWAFFSQPLLKLFILLSVTFDRHLLTSRYALAISNYKIFSVIKK